jgi:hypothetical protein
VSTLANPPYTRAEDMTVLDAKTPSFSGVIAVVGIQACFGSGHESEVVPGIRVFDVTHATRPTLLGQWDLPKATIGCHEVDAVQRADGKVLAVCARNLVDSSDQPPGAMYQPVPSPYEHTVTRVARKRPDDGQLPAHGFAAMPRDQSVPSGPANPYET